MALRRSLTYLRGQVEPSKNFLEKSSQKGFLKISSQKYTFNKSVQKAFGLKDAKGLLYDYDERNNKKEDYIMIKYPKS